jgi:NADH-quinone oxidoreductase subunit J
METLFYVFATGAVLSACMCILQRNPISAVMWLVATMFSVAGIFLLLEAQFIATAQVLVYAGAVMVLFLFVIMLLNLDVPASDLRGPLSMAGAIAVVGLLLVELGALWAYTPERLAAEAAQTAALPPASSNAVLDVAALLFSTYLIPFEVTSVLLLAAIVGAVVLAKRRI